MGLTIHYELRPRQPFSLRVAEALVETAHRRATALVRHRDLAAITPVRAVFTDDRTCPGHFVRLSDDGETVACYDVRPDGGWMFSVQPGPDCEPARFGLCRYPPRMETPDGWRRTEAPAWSFAVACKTQYASLHGAENFLRCHRAVIDLALLWRSRDCEVTITDEGDYWPGRNVEALLKHVNFLNAAIAGMAGAFKDAADDAGGPVVQSPIFAHPQFERLEAEGVAKNGAHIRRALAAARRTAS